MLRLKTTVQQVRTSCANDIRKRDVQIQKLKSHLMSQQRGNRSGLVGASITITPGPTINAMGHSTRDDDSPALDDPEYSLKQETTEFLTQLSQGLSDENDSLIGLVRSTLFTLRELQGMPEQRVENGELSMVEEEPQESTLYAPPTSYEALASDMDVVLENLKSLLTNPNFVPIEEVESREEEIHRLRVGWERMEARWRDALALMEGWRKRMANGGDTINLEELKMGLGLGNGLQTINNDDVSVVSEDEELDSDNTATLDDMEDPPSEEPDDIPEQTSNSDIFKLKLQQPDQPALREGNGNIRSPRKVAFAPSIPNTPSKEEEADENASEMDLVGSVSAKAATTAAASSPQKLEHATDSPASRSSSRAAQPSRIPRHVRCDEAADHDMNMASNEVDISSSPLPAPPIMRYTDLSPLQTPRKKRHSSPRPHPDERSPKLTVQDKLMVAQQAAAEAAAVAEGLHDSGTDGVRNGAAGGEDSIVEELEEQSRRQQQRRRSSPQKKTRIGGRPRRRKSTLTPEELENLLGYE